MLRNAGVQRASGGRAAAEPPVAPRPPVRRRTRGRFVLGLFAMSACAGIALVTVAGPTEGGANAQPYYRQPALAAPGVQRYEIDGGYVLIDPTRDRFEAVVASDGSAAGDSSSGGGGAAASGGGTVTPVGVAQTYAARAVAARGWAPSEFSCLVKLWNRESGWNTHAANPSGAYGIPQALPGTKMGAGWQDDYKVQISWGIGYIAGGYGSPCGALGHSNRMGWY